MGGIKAMQFGRMVFGWSQAFSAAKGQMGSLGVGLGKAAWAFGGLTAAAGTLAASFTATSLALEAVGYDKWLDDLMGVSKAQTSEQGDKEVLDKLKARKGSSDRFIGRLADDRQTKQWHEYGVSSQDEFDEIVAAAKRLDTMRKAGYSEQEMQQYRPEDFARLEEASRNVRHTGMTGQLLAGDELSDYAKERRLYEGRVARNESIAANKKLADGLQREKLETWLNKRLADDADGYITAEEIAKDARKHFGWQVVQQKGQTAEQATAFAEKKNEEIARQIWTFMRQQAGQYGDQYKVGPQVIELHVDGNKVASVTDNALDRRRSEAE